MDKPGVPPTFAVGLTRALIVGYIAFRLEQSLIIGCLIAGAMVGLCTPYAVINRTIAGQVYQNRLYSAFLSNRGAFLSARTARTLCGVLSGVATAGG